MEDWPSSQFNHVILCVPLQKDTMWLECTSQTQQVGYLGSFTCSRPALLVDENNSRLVRTPHYTKAENLQVRTVTGTIDATGNGQLKASAQYKGLLQEKLYSAVLHLSAEKLLDYRKRTLDLPTYDIGSYSCKPGVAGAPLMQEDMDLQVPHLAQVSGKRLFVQPNLLTKWDVRLKADSTRRYDVNLLHEYRFVDSVVLTIPDGYTAEAVPKEKVLHSKFGNYRAWAKVNGNVVTYYRLLETNSGRYPATEFNSLAAFYADVYKADRAQVVFVKNEALP
jgi:hypothetical protein